MKKEITISLVAILALCGCQNKELDVRTLESKPFVATIDDNFLGSETKTSLDSQGNVLWKQGDQISIFAGSTINEQYQVFDDSDGKTSAQLNKISESEFIAGGEIENNVAFYPYSSKNSVFKDGSHYIINCTLPAVQNYAEASFGNGAFPMAAVTSSTADMNLKFKNILGGLKLQLKGTANIKSIEVMGNEGELLCGNAMVTMSSWETPALGLTDGLANKVTLDCGTGIQLNNETATSFVVALPPITMNTGFTVTVIDTEGKQMEIKTIKPQTITRSSILKMPIVEYEGTGDVTTLYSFLPDNVDKNSITKIEFYGNNSTITDKTLPASIPVYYDIDGTTVNIYSQASRYDISNVTPLMFYQYPCLQSIDLTNTIVNNATSFYGMFRGCLSLESIKFGDWNTSNLCDMSVMFSGCRKLRSLDLSFIDTHNVTGERMFGLFNECWCLTSLDLSSFDTSNIDSMTGMFRGCKALSSLNIKSFNTENVTRMDSMFEDCAMLKDLDISNFDTHQVTSMHRMFAFCESMREIDLSKFNTSNVTNFGGMFDGCLFLETLDLSNFLTTKAEYMDLMFNWCSSLISLDISSFSSESLANANSMFGGCQKLQKLNLGSFDPSQANCESIGVCLMNSSKSGAIRCIPETRATLEPTMAADVINKVQWLSLSDNINEFIYQRNSDLYFSSDFSKHETIKKIYSATKGKGIDIVLMGDAYSDRMIADGRYDADMNLAADAIFSKEPMASFKDYFNVYILYLVSENEVLGESTALFGEASGNGIITGYASASIPTKYRIIPTGNGDLTVTDALVVIAGTEYVTGYATMSGVGGEDNPNVIGDYGYGFGASIVARGNPSESEEFKITVAHEFGHSFAKLADEYATINSEITDTYMITSAPGWYKNVDISSNPATIKWSQFISDSRYADDGVGVFEGGYNYTNGVWRPSLNSLMNTGTEFNAPSRAAIYNRIHKLAFGNTWQFDYETFVQYDLKNVGLETRTATKCTNAYHPHLKKEPIMSVEKAYNKDGVLEMNVIMN